VSQPQPPQPPFADPRAAKAAAAAEKAYRKAQRPWFKKKRFVLPIAFFVLLILLVSLGRGDKPAAKTSPGLPAAAEKDPSAPAPFPGAKDDDVVVQAGESVTTDSKIAMTATKLTPGDSTIHKTLCSTVTYQNGGSDTASFNGGFDWKLQDPNGAIIMTGLLGSNNLLNAGQLVPGGKTSGDVCFDAPQGSPSGTYVLLLDPTFRFTSDRIAWINKI
jgi:hypothetical protein